MQKDTRYIYKVIYGKEKDTDDYEVIKKIHYLRCDNEQEKPVEEERKREPFAEALFNNEFKACACNVCDGKPTNCQEVIAYRRKDSAGEYWIRTRSDDVSENNLELLDYCRKIGIASKESVWGW